VRITATAFEPVPEAARALRRSVLQFAAKPRGEAAVDIRVRQLALGDKSGKKQLGIPRLSAAEATSSNCTARYGHFDGPSSCNFIEVTTTSIDELLDKCNAIPCYPHSAQLCRSRSIRRKAPPIHLLKVHVQGDELHVLRGASRMLASGCICAVLLKLSSAALGPENARSIATQVFNLLRSFHIVLLQPNGTSALQCRSATQIERIIAAVRYTEPPSDEDAWDEEGRQKPHPWDKQLLAWSRGQLCQNTLVMAALKVLFA